MKDNILIIYDFGWINGGAAKVAISSAIELAKKGKNVYYFCGVGPIDNELNQQVKKVICTNQTDLINSPSKIMGAMSGIWNVKAFKLLNDLIKEINDDSLIVHIHGWSKCLSASIFKVLKINNIIPYVTLHDYFSICPNGGMYNYRKQKICKLKPCSKACYLCNCDSRHYLYKIWRVMRQIVQNRYVKNNKDNIYIYISRLQFEVTKEYLYGDKFYFLNNPIDIAKKRVDAKKNDYYLYVGRVSKEKGIELFCKALTRLKLKGMVIGDGPEKICLEKKYPQIKFVGWKTKKDIDEIIKKGKVLIFPSKWYEGSPLVVPEMLSAGIPCVVSNKCAAVNNIIDGVNGYVFKNGNVDSLINSISKIELNKDDIFDFDIWPNDYCSMSNHIEKLIKIYDRGINENTNCSYSR